MVAPHHGFIYMTLCFVLVVVLKEQKAGTVISVPSAHKYDSGYCAMDLEAIEPTALSIYLLMLGLLARGKGSPW